MLPWSSYDWFLLFVLRYCDPAEHDPSLKLYGFMSFESPQQTRHMESSRICDPIGFEVHDFIFDNVLFGFNIEQGPENGF